MTVTVRLFAHLRERFGAGQASVEVPTGASVADVWTALSGEDALPSHVLAAVNLEYRTGDAPVAEGDEVAFFPPVTGGRP